MKERIKAMEVEAIMKAAVFFHSYTFVLTIALITVVIWRDL